ncbi:MAG: lysophospholipase [Mucispirillum sp.]|nr:lysophospholipase [Mucispirillum sp.]
MKETNISMPDGLNVRALIFERDNPKAAVQIIHGLKEHKKRYIHFAEFLHGNGYAVIVCDNRGHANSVNDKFPLGYMDGIDLMADDAHTVTEHIKNLYPDTPLYMLGHSFGSLIARHYMKTHDSKISKLVLSGTVGYIKSIPIGIIIAKIITALKGKKGGSKILRALADNGDVSWVCSDKETMEKYRADKFCCGYKYYNAAIYTIFESVKELHNFKAFKCENPNLPILSVTGGLDPVTGGKRGIDDSISSLQRAGYKNIKNILYENMLHEVLNETDKETVYRDILSFFEN